MKKDRCEAGLFLLMVWLSGSERVAFHGMGLNTITL